MENRSSLARTHEEACARVASFFGARWLRHYVGSKLRSDPVFAAAYEILHASREPLLDVGCGVGLLPFYLRERGLVQSITGLDIDRRKVQRGAVVADKNYDGVALLEHDIVTQELSDFRGNIALFDLLHYLPPSVQPTLLRRLARCVPPGGWLLLRDSPRDGTARSWMTRTGERFAQTIAWNTKAPLHFPALSAIHAAFPEKEWTRRDQPAWGRTPFNNRLFIFQRRAS